MPRDPVPLTIPDLSAFAKSLRAGMAQPPSHLQMLGLIAKAAGYRNYQHLLARHRAMPTEPVDDRRVARALRQFAPDGRLNAWPGKTVIQGLCLWVIWARLPKATEMTERGISAHIDAL